MKSTYLVYVSNQGICQSIDYQTDTSVYNTETISLPHCIVHKLSFHKIVNHSNLIIPSTSNVVGNNLQN